MNRCGYYFNFFNSSSIKIKLVLLLLFTMFWGAMAQPNNSSSNSVIDSVKFREILSNVRVAVYSNPDSAYQLLQTTEEFVNKQENLSSKASYLHYLGLIYQIKGEIPIALPNYQKAYQIFKDLNNIQFSNMLLTNIGVCYMLMGQYSPAKENLIQTLKYFESKNDSNNITIACLNLSFISFDLNDEKELESYLNKAIRYAKSPIHKGKIYNNFGELLYNRANYEEALKNYRSSIQFSEIGGDMLTVMMAYHNIGRLYTKKGINDSAYYYFNKVTEKENIYTDFYLLAQVYRDLATLEKDRGNCSKAEQYIFKALDIAKTNKLSKVHAEIYTWLSGYRASQNQYKEAYQYKTMANEITDSLFTEAKNRHIKEIEAIYQNEKKQSEIEMLSAQNKLNMLQIQNNRVLIVSLSILLVLIVVMSVLFFRQSKLQAFNKSLNLEHKLLRTQMNPHFIYNALAAIQNQVMQKPPVEAASYLSGFAKLMRSILNSSRSETIALSAEIDILTEYLTLQKLRFQNKLQYHFSFNLINETDDIAIPPMLLQPFIENAIEHGIAENDQSEGVLWINFAETTDKLTVTLEDNGVGLQNHNNKKPGHKSLATQITAERLNVLSKNRKTKSLLTIENRYNEKGDIAGVKVILQIPLLFVPV